MLGFDNPLHIAIVLVVVLMVFGAKRLPEMGKSMGEGLRGFKAAMTGDAVPSGLADAAPGPALAERHDGSDREREHQPARGAVA
jgi:sec-independent protein translocase protein TatA